MTDWNGTGEKTTGEVVAEDFRTAQVFTRYGIDFCCGGKTAVAEACREKGVDLTRFMADLEDVRREPTDNSVNYNGWSLTFLADYILNTHHVYLKENLDVIEAYAAKIAEVHGGHHPGVVAVSQLYSAVAKDMKAHLREEEELFFPLVKRIDAVRQAGKRVDAAESKAFNASLAKLDKEHTAVGDAVHKLRELANGYEVPGDVCNTYVVTMRKLREFEDDLHKHVHLENNILFPKAVALL